MDSTDPLRKEIFTLHGFCFYPSPLPPLNFFFSNVKTFHTRLEQPIFYPQMIFTRPDKKKVTFPNKKLFFNFLEKLLILVQKKNVQTNERIIRKNIFSNKLFYVFIKESNSFYVFMFAVFCLREINLFQMCLE